MIRTRLTAVKGRFAILKAHPSHCQATVRSVQQSLRHRHLTLYGCESRLCPP